MTVRDDREKEKTSRETLGNFFYDLAKTSFAAMVIGAIMAFFSEQSLIGDTILLLVIGLALTASLAAIGYYIIKK